MLTSIKSLSKLASSFTAETLKSVISNFDEKAFSAFKTADLLHFAVLHELKASIDNELSSVLASVDYVNAERDTQTALFYLVSKDTQANTSKQLCKVYLKKSLASHVVINASLLEKALANDTLKACYDSEHKKCKRFVVDDLQALVKVLKIIIALNK